MHHEFKSIYFTTISSTFSHLTLCPERAHTIPDMLQEKQMADSSGNIMLNTAVRSIFDKQNISQLHFTLVLI